MGSAGWDLRKYCISAEQIPEQIPEQILKHAANTARNTDVSRANTLYLPLSVQYLLEQILMFGGP